MKERRKGERGGEEGRTEEAGEREGRKEGRRNYTDTNTNFFFKWRLASFFVLLQFLAVISEKIHWLIYHGEAYLFLVF